MPTSAAGTPAVDNVHDIVSDSAVAFVLDLAEIL
jgi:hypothetical protein